MIEKEILGDTFYILSRAEYGYTIVLAIIFAVLVCIYFGVIFNWAVTSSRKKKEYMSKLTDKEYRHCDIVRRM